MRSTVFLGILLCLGGAAGQEAAKPVDSTAARSMPALLNVKRVYVAELTGGAGADALRELLIASLDSLKLFTLTDNPDRADAVLRGAADDKAFTDTFDSAESISTRENGGRYSPGTSSSKSKGGYLGASVASNEAHHIKERKHEAYATVRLCDKDGDVLWSTTQESLGAKFRGAGADVAAKVARQLALDMNRMRQSPSAPVSDNPTPAPAKP